MLDGREAYINDENEFGHYPEGTWVLLKRYSLGGNRTRVLTRKLRRSALWKIIWNGAVAEERDKWSGGSLGWTLGDTQCLSCMNLNRAAFGPQAQQSQICFYTPSVFLV